MQLALLALDKLNKVMLSISLILKTSPSIPAAINRARYRKAIIILTATATVIRLELGLFVLPTVLSLIRLRKITWREGFTWGAIGGFGSLREHTSLARFTVADRSDLGSAGSRTLATDARAPLLPIHFPMAAGVARAVCAVLQRRPEQGGGMGRPACDVVFHPRPPEDMPRFVTAGCYRSGVEAFDKRHVAQGWKSDERDRRDRRAIWLGRVRPAVRNEQHRP